MEATTRRLMMSFPLVARPSGPSADLGIRVNARLSQEELCHCARYYASCSTAHRKRQVKGMARPNARVDAEFSNVINAIFTVIFALILLVFFPLVRGQANAHSYLRSSIN